MKTIAFRVLPGQDLRAEIDRIVAEENIQAAVLLTCVGSLKKAVLRMAGATEEKIWEEDFEIVALVGTMGSGKSHLHVALSDKQGKVIGGHLAQGSLVRTTAEVVIGEIEEVRFLRKRDPVTGFDELHVEKL